MNPMQLLGKSLIVIGLLIATIGLIMILTKGAFPIGNLPGDITIKRDNFNFYFPITTSIILSIVLTLIIWLVSRFAK
jgi:formate hydrogenlyase subunit 3/multisubunit Na+/H+ antiporter MnhD subunit